MTLRRTIAPAVEPVTLAEAKSHLRVDGSDEDSLISSLITAAVEHFDGEGTLGRAMVNQTWSQYFSPTPYRPRLLMTPFSSLVSVQYYNNDNELQTDTLSNYETWVEQDYVICKPKEGFEWPDAYDRPDAIQVNYVAGFGATAGDVPTPLKQAILLTVGHWFEQRTSFASVEFKEVPLSAEALMNNYRVGWYG